MSERQRWQDRGEESKEFLGKRDQDGGVVEVRGVRGARVAEG